MKIKEKRLFRYFFVKSAPLPKFDQKGQTTLEFALTLVLLLSFTFFYLQLTLVFAVGNYIHYATFMSARAYLSAGGTRDDQSERAQTVIAKMIKKGVGQPDVERFPSIAKGDGDGDPGPLGTLRGMRFRPPEQFKADEKAYSWLEGVRYTFKSKLFLIPLGGSRRGSVNSLTLTAESWLGREPNFDECLKLVDKGYIDNGC